MESVDITPVLDHLILDLRQPNYPNAYDLIDRFAYYLPILKNEANIPLLLAELLASSSVFGPALDLDRMSYLIDRLQYSIDRKLRVTDPSIPKHVWVEILLHFCNRIPIEDQWKTLPLYSALVKQIHTKRSLIGSYPSRRFTKHAETAITGFGEAMNSSIVSPDIMNLTIFCLARSKPELELLPYNAVADPSNLLQHTLGALYKSPGSLLDFISKSKVETAPNVLTHIYLSGYSFLIKDLILLSPPSSLITQTLVKTIAEFTEILDRKRFSTNLDFSFQKSCLFGILVQFQGLATAILQKAPISISIDAAKSILTILQILHYITIEIGQAGFDQYNYIYYLCIDVLLSNRYPLDEFFNELQKRTLDVEGFHDCRLVFLFDLIENILPGISDAALQGNVLLLIQQYLKPLDSYHGKYGREILESAHSAMIKLLSQKPAVVSSGADTAYFETALNMFPSVFSSKQFKIAAIHVAESMTADRLDGFLQSFFHRCKCEMPGVVLPGPENATVIETAQHLPGDIAPPTTRAALVSVFITLIPYTRPLTFARWLNQLESLIGPPLLYSVAVEQEHSFLLQETWRMISEELPMELQEIGIPWWYNHLNKKNRL